MSSKKLSDTREIYSSSIVIDGLACAEPSPKIVQMWLNSGITAANWTVASAREDAMTALNKITQYYWLLEQQPHLTLLVRTADDILRAKKEKRLGVIMGFQGVGPLGYSVNLLRIYRELGVRIVQFAYNDSSPFAAGCLEPGNSGLTSLGIQGVREMNRMGMVIDLSHVGYRSAMEAIELSADPVIFSHSCALALQKNPRNIPDDIIQACAAKGGVIGLATFSAFVGDTTNARQPGLDEYLRHFDHIINLVGEDHVAVGTDAFADATDGTWWRAVTGRVYPAVSQGMTYETHNIKGFSDQSEFANAAGAMLAHGFGEGTVRKILGENWLRVYRQVWQKITPAGL
jgi:membrane dipeptidase